MNVEKSSK